MVSPFSFCKASSVEPLSFAKIWKQAQAKALQRDTDEADPPGVVTILLVIGKPYHLCSATEYGDPGHGYAGYGNNGCGRKVTGSGYSVTGSLQN